MNQLTINQNYSKSLFFAKVLRRIPFCGGISVLYNERRHKRIETKLRPVLDYSIQLVIHKKEYKKYEGSNIIWIFWWQGKDNMPLLVKKCYKSIERNKGKREIILVTKDNIREYAKIPEYIYKKVEEKKITLTHFSDILRFNLLNNYGGIWVDATIYAASSLNKFDTNFLFTCSGLPKDNYFNVSYGRWTGFLIGGPAHLKLFQFMDTFFSIYWKYNNVLIDYFLIDYALNFVWNKNVDDFQNVAKKYKDITPNLFKLESNLNNRYDKQKWEELTKSTNVFKLSYKKKINYADKKNFFYYL